MKTLNEMKETELHNLNRFLTSVELSIELGKKSHEELRKIAIDYWAELEIDSPEAALLGELIERLEDAWNINQEPEEQNE